MKMGPVTLCAIAALPFCLSSKPIYGQCTATETQELSASGTTLFGFYGSSVGLRGDVAIVGAPGPITTFLTTGEAKVFRLVSGTWTEEVILTADDAQLDDGFGSGVATEGDIAIVGALNEDTSPTSSQGAAYVFEFDGTEWDQIAKVIGSGSESEASFGNAVALSGERFIVGAFLENEGITQNTGSVYVYELVNSVWQETAKLNASDLAAQDQFGFSVAIDGNVIIVGAPMNFTAAGDDAGSAYIFRWNSSTSTWDEEQILTASDAAADDEFGFSVDVRGDLAIVGARTETELGSDAGAAYIFSFNETTSTWVEQAKLTASDGEASDEFGTSVSIDGNVAVVGSFAGDGIESDTGAAYVFHFDGANWNESFKLVSAEGVADAQFGDRVSLDDATVVIGQPDFSVVTVSRAFVFAGIQGADCDEDLVEDLCEISAGTEPDCNHNGVPDACDLANQTSEDCNGNGIPDECETDCNGNGVPDDCDIALGTSEDCDGNGLPDECAVSISSPIETLSIVVIFDTSSSQSADEDDFCDRMTALETVLESSLSPEITVQLTLWGITAEGSWTCLTSDVEDEICSGGSPPSYCSPSFGLEDWGRASAAVAEGYNWPDPVARIIIPFSDEGPENGDPCQNPGPNVDAIQDAIAACTSANVIALPILGRFPTPSPDMCIIHLMDDLAEATGGQRFESESETLVSDLADWMLNFIDGFIVDCDDDGIPDVCENDCDCDGIIDDCDTDPDNDENGIPDNCDVCYGCPEDIDQDGVIGFNDLLLVLNAWETDDEDADIDDSGLVGFADLLLVLDAWGPCNLTRPCPCEPLSLEDALAAVCLDEDDLDDYIDVIDSGAQQDKDRYECWFEAYLNGGGSCDPPNSCPTPDPFAE